MNTDLVLEHKTSWDQKLIPWAVGGLSILLFVFFWLFVEKNSDKFLSASSIFFLNVIINYPHFMASYQILYGDFKKEIFKKISFFGVGVFVPLFLICVFIYAFSQNNSELFGLLLNVMFFLVGWHYVKQTFGIVIVISNSSDVRYSKYERLSILSTLLSFWLFVYFYRRHFLTFTSSKEIYDINYSIWLFNEAWFYVACFIFFVSLFSMIYLLISKYINTGKIPPNAAIIGFLSQFVWSAPLIQHKHFATIIPFFHCLQYLVFVYYLKKNQTTELSVNKNEEEKRKIQMGYFVGFFIKAIILGLLCFAIIPKSLDYFTDFDPSLGETPFLAAFTVFINIHHYFIDSVIWKYTNEPIKRHLRLPNN